ncbi:DUF4269 domain-containing protein [Tenacibaculum sp. 190524A02b]|uniref:DUF4269 domain-containing protein n=1 Tax=Tenacibaculum vairaonense TaxID=3137860 RepID=UPI0031FB8DBE
MKPSINFENISYLKTGNDTQRNTYTVLTSYSILEKLKMFTPILVGTIPINIHIESSDLDIICYHQDKSHLKQLIINNFSSFTNFKLWESETLLPTAIVASFIIEGFEIEIFGQNIPTKQQNAYKHMLIEYKLLQEYGEVFRQKIISLKQKGYKTEPAFAIELGLKGDPYEALLKLE